MPPLAAALALLGSAAADVLREVAVARGVDVVVLLGVLLGLLLRDGLGQLRVTSDLSLSLTSCTVKSGARLVQPRESRLDVGIDLRRKIVAM
jgi:hypothetical protein